MALPAVEEVGGLGTPIYLDYNATTPVHPEVAGAMLPYLRRSLRQPVQQPPRPGWSPPGRWPRRGCRWPPFWAAGRRRSSSPGAAREANNLALKGVAWARRERGRHLIISAVEHPAVTEPARFLRARGWEVTVAPGRRGRAGWSRRRWPAALRADTVLVSIMHANNETGSINPLREIAAVCRERGVLLHTDAAQSVGKIRHRRGSAGSRPAHGGRPQALRAQGGGRALRPAREWSWSRSFTGPGRSGAAAPARRTSP